MTGMIARRIACFACLATAAATQPVKAQAVQEYRYEPDAIYTIRTGLGITTQIELSPSERVVDYSTGFSSGWELTRRDNVFYLKPRNVDVDTNMMVRTETHSYIFELKVVATDWTALEQAKNEGVQYKVRFNYPSGTEFIAKADAAPGLSASLAGDRSYNFDYDYAGRGRSAWLVPVNVYDDGQFTYIRMNDMKNVPSGNFPAVFARDREGGDDYVVNTTVEDDTIIVHGTYRYLVIRYGKDVVGLRRNDEQ